MRGPSSQGEGQAYVVPHKDSVLKRPYRKIPRSRRDFIIGREESETVACTNPMTGDFADVNVVVVIPRFRVTNHNLMDLVNRYVLSFGFLSSQQSPLH